MGFLIEGEVIGLEREREGCGLTEAEGEAFAGDSVDGAGGVADEGDVAGGDATEFAVEGDGSSRSTTERSVGKVMLQGWELAESFCCGRRSLICNISDADLVGRGWGDVGLAMVAPVDLNEVGPRSDRVVLAKADAAGVDGGGGEAGCCGDAGLMAVRSDEVASAQCLMVGADDSTLGSWLDSSNSVLPVESDAKAFGAVDEKFVENGATDASARA